MRLMPEMEEKTLFNTYTKEKVTQKEPSLLCKKSPFCVQS